ncbi:MAG: M20 family metallopeptidase [Clostridia bacterium]
MDTDWRSYMVEIRRQLHRHPELSTHEVETRNYIAARIKALGLVPHFCCDTGVYADLVINEAAPFLVFRADIDALPLNEESTLPYASVNTGVMHACGHDGHTAMLLGAMSSLCAQPKDMRYNVRFVFQPAEERYGGAKRMLESGVLPPNAVAAFAFHLWPQLPYGQIGIKAGALMCSNSSFSIEIKGISAHCAMREQGRDALLAGMDIAQGLRKLSASLNENDLVFIGSFHAGECYNAVAGACQIEGTVRTFSAQTDQHIRQELLGLADHAQKHYGVSVAPNYLQQYPVLYNNAQLAQKLLDELDVPPLDVAYQTGEDFAFWGQKVKSIMLLLGINEGSTPPLHSKCFNFNENIMTLGAGLYCKLTQMNWE